MSNVIDYLPGTTVLHRLNPVAKLALAACIILATFLAHSFPALIGLLALTLCLSAYAGSLGRLLSLLGVLVPLGLLMFALQTLFVRSGAPLVLGITDEGIASGARTALRLMRSPRR